MKAVIIESPFAGNWERNLKYLRACMKDCLKRGEAPFASHALYTQEGVLDDNIPSERKLGIDAGLEIGSRMDATVVYTDLGITDGMKQGMEHAGKESRPIECRSIPKWRKEKSYIENRKESKDA